MFNDTDMFSEPDMYNDTDRINIKGIDKAELMAGLFNASKTQGMGFFSKNSNTKMTVERAREEIQILKTSGKSFVDYLDGRYMKVDLGKDTLDASRYDGINGKGTASKVVAALRDGKKLEFSSNVNQLIAAQLAELEDEELSRSLFMNAFKGPM